jgi:SAM-dependent methyltransferase
LFALIRIKAAGRKSGRLTFASRSLVNAMTLSTGRRSTTYHDKWNSSREPLMGFYSDVILPRLCDFAMRNKQLVPLRERVIGEAEGRVLEIGVGSGLNLPFYRPPVREVLALEPAPRLLTMAQSTMAEAGARVVNMPVRFLEASAEAIPIDRHSVDTVVTTWTLCSIPHADAALAEMRRVLRPGGRLLFVEHGQAPDEGVRRWQDRLTPAWRCITGGCHLNRPIRAMIEAAGFGIDRIETGYIPGPRPMTFMYQGSARPG